MSNNIENFNFLFSERFRSERKRLGLKQYQAADLCGVSREMWGKYERGHSRPGCEVLFAFAAIGADINSLFKHDSTAVDEPKADYTVLRPDQSALLDNYEHCSKELKRAVAKLALIGSEPDTNESKQNTQLKISNHD